MIETQEFLTVAEVAKCLRLSVATIYTMANRNEIPGIVRIRKSIRFSADVFDRWLAEQTHNGIGAAPESDVA